MDAFESGAALCAPFLSGLPVAGLSISVMSETGAQSTIGVSDPVAARLEELQFELGEGPTSDVMRSGRPVLAPDLLADVVQRGWPVFSPAALDAGARGLFSLPMLVGAATVGVVSLYALVLLPPWSETVLRAAVGLAEAAVQPAVALAARSAAAEDRSQGRQQIEMRREVHQASGMVMVQLGCSIGEAMTRLRAYAFAVDQPIDLVAREVVAGMLDLAALGD